jgi:hypothetical protein
MAEQATRRDVKPCFFPDTIDRHDEHSLLIFFLNGPYTGTVPVLYSSGTGTNISFKVLLVLLVSHNLKLIIEDENSVRMKWGPIRK